ncbi:hypothetical protein SKAU_G00167220 [Synaphobranchus kaupii]|uniref:Uncharacterized protein n=1 Tax=Synaphobranchus kaupii TaxID=118154 RepID=A0A9Q1J0G7_SYNKA|nr:hypothetical protein SKAU_G00167220 [Synaphobranchus kaupii]
MSDAMYSPALMRGLLTPMRNVYSQTRMIDRKVRSEWIIPILSQHPSLQPYPEEPFRERGGEIVRRGRRLSSGCKSLCSSPCMQHTAPVISPSRASV